MAFFVNFILVFQSLQRGGYKEAYKMTLRPYAMLAFVALVACSASADIQPDAKNPAHCIAAFNFAQYRMIRGGDKMNEAGARIALAREEFEFRSLPFGNSSDKNSINLTKKFSKNDEVMLKLLKECWIKQDSDPAFQRYKSSGEFSKVAEHATLRFKRD